MIILKTKGRLKVEVADNGKKRITGTVLSDGKATSNWVSCPVVFDFNGLYAWGKVPFLTAPGTDLFIGTASVQVKQNAFEITADVESDKEEVLKIIEKGKGFGLQVGIGIDCVDMVIVNGGKVNGRTVQGKFYHVTKADIRHVRICGK